jgi:hypothetical protein
MRKRGSSRKKLRIRIARKNRPPTAMTAATAARMRPVLVGGMRPRLTGMRRRARRNVSSSVSGSPSAGCLAGLRLPVRSEETSCVILARAADVAAGRKNCSTGSSSANTVTRFACESIFATPESGREICHPNYIAVFQGLLRAFSRNLRGISLGNGLKAPWAIPGLGDVGYPGKGNRRSLHSVTLCRDDNSVWG